MGAQQVVATVPAQLVRAPATYGLYQRILVTAPATTLAALCAGAVIPQIPVPNFPNRTYSFRFVDLSSEVNPLAVTVRYTDDGQTAPTATLGFVIPQEPAWVRIPCDPADIQLCSAGVDVQVQVRFGILGTEGT